MRLVEHSDVFVENLKMSTLHQIGLHESQLLDRNPRLLVLRIPPAGLTGDYANYTGFGAQFDGLSGFAQLIGHHDIEMVETPATMYMDAATGPAGAFAVLAALHYRAATGRGQLIELAQIENAMNQLGDVFVDVQLGKATPRDRQPRPGTGPAGDLPVSRRREPARHHRPHRRGMGGAGARHRTRRSAHRRAVRHRCGPLRAPRRDRRRHHRVDAAAGPDACVPHVAAGGRHRGAAVHRGDARRRSARRGAASGSAR